MDERTSDLMAEPRYERLPKWARNEIERLAANVDHYQGKIREMIEDKTGGSGNTLVERLVGEDVALPDGTWVTYSLDNGAKISIRNAGEYVDVRSTQWHQRMAVLPQSGNVVHLMGLDR